jgi:ribosomal protein L35
MPKLKPHKGTLKRVRITGGGKVKFNSANTGHLKSGKGGKKLRQLRAANIAHSSDVGRLERLLLCRLKGRDTQ